MPQLKKLSLFPGNILPKVDLNEVLSSDKQNIYSSSYLAMLMDRDSSQMLSSDSDSTESGQNRPRKRQRLDHLSQEEKIMRRKLKNRVAAQTARDRKKAKMTELEEQNIELKKTQKLLLEKIVEQQSLITKQAERIDSLEKRLTDLETGSNERCTVNDLKVSSNKQSVADSRVLARSGSLEQAAGTGSTDDYALDDAISLFASNSEAVDLLDLLQQCSEDFMQCDLTSTACEDGESRKQQASAPEVVGTTAESLESHKELIHFDHIYYKQENSSNAAEALSLPVSELSTKEDIIPQNLIFNESNEALSDSPQISITPPVDSDSKVLHFDCESFTFVDDQLLFAKNMKQCSSPASSDAGYDSSFSAGSPAIVENNVWDDTLTELFPSLV